MGIESVEEVRVFRQIVDSGSLAAAGRVLRISPSLISRRLANLEERLRVRLIERTTRSMRVTPEGRAFHRRAIAILAAIDSAEDELRADRDALRGLLRVQLPTVSLCTSLFAELPALLEAHPALEVDLHITDHPGDPIADGYDLVIHAGEPPESSHIARRITTVTPVLAASPAYLERCGAPRALPELASHRCLRWSGTGPQTHWLLVDRRGETHVVEVGGNLQSDSSEALAQAIYAGLGVGIRPAPEVERAAERGQLVRVLPDYELPPTDIFGIYAGSRHGSPRLSTLIEFLERVLVFDRPLVSPFVP